MLTDAEKVDVRRFAGYGNYGQQALPASGYRFSTAYGTLEYKLNTLLPDEESTLRTVFLTRLRTLETDLVDQTTQNLDTDQAAVWVHNKNEHRDRRALFFDFRRQMCGFLGIPPGPNLGKGGGMTVVV
ncbi:hypothetical protein ACKZDW_07925 [Ralstonia syzygii subsp. celebesensis]|uniref:Uncharacterized protein n=2 Tax=Ralstonia syzygii subsp. celebesensis TaxID=1310168 RepID=A0A1U9VDH7_9RALS|nr:hypothetical protein [Ralstonia syzygii]AQW28646.1 hypothetical protein B0B51_00470 [blood disease bacterium A2-HR MARDI]CCA82211.1 conserved hypothetical protein [blood disease bacterium R229]